MKNLDSVLIARLDMLALALAETLAVLSAPQASACAAKLRARVADSALPCLDEQFDAAAAGQLAALLGALDSAIGRRVG